ncbi:MAG: hypothetical protein IT184_04880 [Acidobacteria bacterium]|nr:hypothetical protein [Acidobacteriota bacterium]
MADTEHLHAEAPVEGDGVNYRGIIWFVVILTVTTLFCQVLVWGVFEIAERVHVTHSGVVRSPMATPSVRPHVDIVTNTPDKGRIVTGLERTEGVPHGAFAPGLLVDEPSVLRTYRHQEDASLSTYGWVDKAAGVVRLPIARAKTLVLERGLAARSDRPGGAQPLPALPAAPSRDASGGSAH